MRVLVACEFSGVVRDAFIARGHDAYSVDLLPSERPGPHMEGRVEEVVFDHAAAGFDLMIAFPPCTYLASSGARWWSERRVQQLLAISFIRWLAGRPVPRIAIENPIGRLSTQWRRPDQIIQPWMFGHGETKATCLWLKNLPLLQPTKVVDGRTPRVHHAPPKPNRWKDRSRTLPGIAEAMAEQWGRC